MVFLGDREDESKFFECVPIPFFAFVLAKTTGALPPPQAHATVPSPSIDGKRVRTPPNDEESETDDKQPNAEPLTAREIQGLKSDVSVW